jgi:hypothetical protein
MLVLSLPLRLELKRMAGRWSAARAKAAKAVLKRLAAVEAAERKDAEEAEAVAELERRNSSLAAQLLALKRQTRVPLQGLATAAQAKQDRRSPRVPLSKAHSNERRSTTPGLGLAGKAMTVSSQPLEPTHRPMR